MKELLPYIDRGLTINPNNFGTYDVFTIPTQHFKINSLEELTVTKFEEMILKQNLYQNNVDQMFEGMFPNSREEFEQEFLKLLKNETNP